MKLRTWLNMAPYTVENLDDSNHTGMRILGKSQSEASIVVS